MDRVSEAKSVNELQGHRVLYRVRGSGELKDAVVAEFACGGKFVSLWGNWREAANVEVVEDFGAPPAPAAWAGNEEFKKLREENASMKGQLEQARTELARIDARIQAGVPGILPSGEDDLVDEVIGLLRVAQGDRDANERLYLECRAKLRALQGPDNPPVQVLPEAPAATEGGEQAG